MTLTTKTAGRDDIMDSFLNRLHWLGFEVDECEKGWRRMPCGVGSAYVMHGERMTTHHALVLTRLDQHGVRFEESVGRDARLGRKG